LEQAWRKLGAILWRNSVIFGENFSDGQILSAILLELRSKLSHLGRREILGQSVLIRIGTLRNGESVVGVQKHTSCG
jgi:hypothetical protein